MFTLAKILVMYVSAIFNDLGSTVYGSGFTGPFSPTDEYVVGGFYTPGDGGGGIFVWIPFATTADGGITINNANYTAGHFKRIYSGPINVKWFGATGDGTTPDTLAVQAAITAAGNGTVYFPAGTYFGNFVAEHCNILGDGFTTVLLAHTNGIPVLKLGYIPTSEMTFAKVSSLVIDGSTISNGIEFDAATNGQLAGRWDIEHVKFMNCLKAVYKPKGNIINSIVNCHFSSNEFGFYAEHSASPYMHSGCDRIVGGHMDGCTKAAIYVKSEGQYGQLILDGITIEGNQGFGIFIHLTGYAAMTFTGIELRNIWMEQNAMYSSVTIDTVTYTPRDLRFENVRSVSISQMLIMDIELIASSVNLYNCHSDNIYSLTPNAWPYKIDVDGTSALVAYELRYAGEVADTIYVNSISYDGTGDIASVLTNLPIPNTSIPTSVWGPLRCVNQYGTYDLKISQRFYKSGPRKFETVNGVSDVNGYNQNGGILLNECIALDIPANDEIRSTDDVWTLDPSGDWGNYYVWSIHSFACLIGDLANSVTGVIKADDGTCLGQVFFKQNLWACSYGVKKMINNPVSKHMFIYLSGGHVGGSIMLCDYQVVRFDNYYDACSFLNSKAFADGDPACRKG